MQVPEVVVVVGHGVRHHARCQLEEAGYKVASGYWMNGSTAWGWLVEGSYTPAERRELAWNSGVGWVEGGRELLRKGRTIGS